ncbi:MAG: hypothetical protein GX448_19815 [Planctomycetes bacterium]|nr:hypothetical protein [Planctomycetota bacterium]
MARQRLDWRFAAVLFVASATFVATVWIVRHWHRNNLSRPQASTPPVASP